MTFTTEQLRAMVEQKDGLQDISAVASSLIAAALREGGK